MRQPARAIGSTDGRRAIGGGGAAMPAYRQLYVVMLQRIREGAFDPDGPLPSEMQLARDYAVSRVTVRRTLDLLEQDGLIQRRRGLGTFLVVDAGPSGGGPISGLLDNLITIGLETQAETLGETWVDRPPARIAQALNLADGARCFTTERLRWHGGEPFSHTLLWLPEQVATRLPLDSLGDRPVITLLEQSGFRPTSADQILSAKLADDRTAAVLQTEIGAAIISLRRTVRDQTGAPVLHQQSAYHPDRYEYHMLLTRDNTSARPQWRHTG